MSQLAFKRGPRARACDTCRRWKKKCDQVKPSCTRCTEAGATCTYSYVKDYYQYEATTASLRLQASQHTYSMNLNSIYKSDYSNHYYSYPSVDTKETRSGHQQLPSLRSLSLPTAPTHHISAPSDPSYYYTSSSTGSYSHPSTDSPTSTLPHYLTPTDHPPLQPCHHSMRTYHSSPPIQPPSTPHYPTYPAYN